MPRIARIVVPGLPHHVTQRGVRRMQTFFNDDDYRLYRSLVAEYCAKAETAVWAYCLMPNHVHLIVVPSSQAGLARGLGEVHRRYTRAVNLRKGWRGYLWQGRFASFVMDESHLIAAACYVELNPVRAGLVKRPRDWSWSSARAHLAGNDDEIVDVAPLLDVVPDWAGLLAGGLTDDEAARLRKSERTGRPLGDETFIRDLETRTGRRLVRRKPGPKSPQ